MSKATLEFKIKENGKPQIKLSKKLNTTYGFMRNNKFSSKEGNIFISEIKHNSKTYKSRSFVMSIRNIGSGQNEGEYRLQQLSLDEEELIQLKDYVDIILNYNK